MIKIHLYIGVFSAYMLFLFCRFQGVFCFVFSAKPIHPRFLTVTKNRKIRYCEYGFTRSSFAWSTFLPIPFMQNGEVVLQVGPETREIQIYRGPSLNLWAQSRANPKWTSILKSTNPQKWRNPKLVKSKTTKAGRGLVPDLITYGSAISACESCGQWELGCFLMMQLEKQRLQTDLITYNATWRHQGFGGWDMWLLCGTCNWDTRPGNLT